jgi:hypothetical protein
VGVLGDGVYQGRRSAATAEVIVVCAFAASPPPVLAAGVGGRLTVYFLPQALPDICDVEVAGEPVERVSPGIAQAECPDFVVARLAYEGVVGRDSVVSTGPLAPSTSIRRIFPGRLSVISCALPRPAVCPSSSSPAPPPSPVPMYRYPSFGPNARRHASTSRRYTDRRGGISKQYVGRCPTGEAGRLLGQQPVDRTLGPGGNRDPGPCRCRGSNWSQYRTSSPSTYYISIRYKLSRPQCAKLLALLEPAV